MGGRRISPVRREAQGIVLLIAILWATPLLRGGQFHVRPAGTPRGDGSFTRSWDIQTALNNPPAVQPGDTIWLHGGVYRGTFESNLLGTPQAPILVRSYPGEWAILDNGGSNDTAFWLKGANTWFWGFEVRNSGSAPTRNEGAVNFASSDGNRLINVIIHDAGTTGINPYATSTNATVYGSLVYYNGRFDDTTRLNGYGIYGQNAAPSKKTVADNFFFNMFGIFPVHMTGSSNAKIDDMRFTGNTMFGHTLFDDKNVVAVYGNFEPGSGKNLYPAWDSNYFYRCDLWLGYNGDGVDSATLTDNHFFGGELDENPGNTYRDSTGNIFSMAENRVFIRPNLYADAYDPRRANVIVYNARRDTSVAVTLPPGVLRIGDTYQFRDVQNYFGPPVTAGTYDGGPIVLQMPDTPDPITQPVTIPLNRPGHSPPRHTDREFGAFILLANLTNLTWPLGVEDRRLPERFLLSQNYPNPFNPASTIRYMLPERSIVRIVVYSLLGEEVATLVDGIEEAGEHTVIVNGRSIASGVYFYRMTAGAFSSVRKMILVR